MLGADFPNRQNLNRGARLNAVKNEKFNRYPRSALPEADISLEEYLDRITRSNSYAMHSPVKKHSVHTTVTTLFFGSRPVVSISKASICAAYAHTHTSEALF